MRREASPLYEQWDNLIEAGRFEDARRVRLTQLWPRIKRAFESEASQLPGVYMFADNSSRCGWASVNYFGQATGTLRERLAHYVRDDSCWDEAIVGEPHRLSEIALTRLRPVMPSTPEVLNDHVVKHQNTLRKTRGCSLFVAGFDRADAEVTTPVEAAMIAVSWSYGAPLENDKLEKLPRIGTRVPILQICEDIFRGWNACGLHDELSRSSQSISAGVEGQ